MFVSAMPDMSFNMRHSKSTGSLRNLSVNDPFCYRCCVCGIGFELETVNRLACGHFAHNKCYHNKSNINAPICTFRHIKSDINIKGILKKNNIGSVYMEKIKSDFSKINIINKHIKHVRFNESNAV